MEMEETLSDASYFTRTMANSSPDPISPPSDPGGGHTAAQDGLQLLVADDTTPVTVYDENSRCYDMRGAKYLYIFNHEKYKRTPHFWFKLPPQRLGTNEDVTNLTSTFKDQGYKVAAYTDLKYREIIRIVTAIANQDHSRTSIVCIAILTHGENKNAVLAADRSYRLTQIEHLLQNGNLVGKPKVLLVQACRAGHVDDGRRLKLNTGKTVVVPTPADFLIMHATFSDYYAFLNSSTGSFLIKAVCEALRENPELSYGDFISVVNRKVASRATKNSKNPKRHNKKQSPETRVTLMKSLIFKQLPEVASRANGTTTAQYATWAVPLNTAMSLWYGSIDWVHKFYHQVFKEECTTCTVCDRSNVDKGRVVILENGNTTVLPSTADFLFIHAADNDQVSLSNLIRAICEALRENPELKDEDLILIINQKVASNTNPPSAAVIPETRNTLTEAIRFIRIESHRN